MKFLKKIREKLNSKEEKTEERTYILDTSALNSSEAMQIIEEASKIIILTGIIQELDNNKHNPNKKFSDNVCTICKKSREDQNSEKYICVAGYEKYSYQDDNIIDYCQKHKNVTILTCDNNLCNKAKAYDIPYIFPKRDKEIKEKAQNLLKVEKEKDEEKAIEKSSDQEIFFEKRWIRAKNNNNYVNYINVERKGKLIKTQDYAAGDLLYLSKYNKKKNNLEIHVYRIVNKNNRYTAEKLEKYKLWLINEIYSIKLSEELQDDIRSFFVKYARY